MHRIALSTLPAFFAALSFAQPCEPDWNTAIGTPGVTGGYVAPIVPWNDGSGEKLYVGGSFTRAGNLTSARYLARWDRAAGAWSALGAGISPGNTNAYVTSILPFNSGAGPRLVVGGWYASAGGVANTACLAMWNGTTWQSLGTGWTPTLRGAVWAMTEWNGRLYIGGQIFPAGANVPEGAMAHWNGSTWIGVPSLMTGYSPSIFAFARFDDGSGEESLYVGGRFNDMNGTPGTVGIARWDGAAWHSVGGGFASMNSIMGVFDLHVFNDGTGPALYASTYNLLIPGQASPGGFIACQIVKWNGSAWSQVGDWLGTGVVEDIEEFDDGSGTTLYIGGQALPDVNYFNKLENGQWVVVGGGFTAVAPPWPGVFGLGAWGDSLYVGGIFTDVEGPPATNIVAWQGCPPSCVGDVDSDGDVDLQDLAFLLAHFGTPSGASAADGDTDGDADVDLQDLANLLGRFGESC